MHGPRKFGTETKNDSRLNNMDMCESGTFVVSGQPDDKVLYTISVD